MGRVAAPAALNLRPSRTDNQAGLDLLFERTVGWASFTSRASGSKGGRPATFQSSIPIVEVLDREAATMFFFLFLKANNLPYAKFFAISSLRRAAAGNAALLRAPIGGGKELEKPGLPKRPDCAKQEIPRAKKTLASRPGRRRACASTRGKEAARRRADCGTRRTSPERVTVRDRHIPSPGERLPVERTRDK